MNAQRVVHGKRFLVKFYVEPSCGARVSALNLELVLILINSYVKLFPCQVIITFSSVELMKILCVNRFF